MVSVDQRNFITVGVIQLAVAEVVAIVQGCDVLVAQRALAGGNEYRLLIGVAGLQVLKVRFKRIAMIAAELMPEWKIVSSQAGKWW